MKARIFIKVLAAHAIVIGVLLVGSLVKNWFKPDPIPVMDVTLVSDPLAAKPTADKPAPQPRKPAPQPPKPEPEPVKVPEPPPKPKPALKKPSEIKVNKQAVKRRTDVKKVEPKPIPVKKRDSFDMSKFRVEQDSANPIVNPTAKATAAANPSEMARFEAMLAGRLKQPWIRPAAWPGGGLPTVVVSVTVSRDGRVSGARIVTPSPYQALNDSALRAAQAVTTISGIPRGFPVSKTYLIDYVLQQ